jgi:S1-C subfamily serine protease
VKAASGVPTSDSVGASGRYRPGWRGNSARATASSVVQVVDESPAAKAGLRLGDLIVAVDGQNVGGMTDLQRLMIGERIGTPVAFTVARDSSLLEITVTPTELEP